MTAWREQVLSSPDWVGNTGDELHKLGNSLRRISRMLHDHAQKLEVEVEGRYANEAGDTRVRLLSDSLHLSRIADLELGRLNQALQRMVKLLQEQAKKNATPNATLEKERDALATNITYLKQQREELGTLYEI